jgi:hypothetical protein
VHLEKFRQVSRSILSRLPFPLLPPRDTGREEGNVPSADV